VFRDRIYKIRTLEHFNCYEAGVDKGSGVREKSKQVVELLGNNEAIRSEREKARSLRNKFVGISNDGRGFGGGGGGRSYSGGNDRDNYSSGIVHSNIYVLYIVVLCIFFKPIYPIVCMYVYRSLQ